MVSPVMFLLKNQTLHGSILTCSTFMIFSDFQSSGFPFPFNFPALFRTLLKPEIAKAVTKPMKHDTPDAHRFVYILWQLLLPRNQEFSLISRTNPGEMGIVRKLETRRIRWCRQHWIIRRSGDFMPCSKGFSFIFNI